MTRKDIQEKKEKIAVIGMGYVGMPLAVSLSKYFHVIGYDINPRKIECYKNGVDPTGEVGDDELKKSHVLFSSNEIDLDKASIYIVAVPTPINIDKTPNLNPVESASELVGRHLTKGNVIVYESTVYPGVTEDICVPILEKVSGLKYLTDFAVGYSPERINPGDKVHRLETIKKIVSGSDEKTLEIIAEIYQTVVEVGVHKVSSIKVAEAAKVAENSQRDINIAFMNELAMVFDKMGIDTNEVVDAMNTKWNALGFRPGLVGGHCIGVDPYYFVYQAEKLGYHSQIILSGRKVNDGMGAFVAEAAIKKLIESNVLVRESKVVILGVTFKENCPDLRNSKVIDIIEHLNEYGIEPIVMDSWANFEELEGKVACKKATTYVDNVDCVICAVAHEEYKCNPLNKFVSFRNESKKVVVDVKGIKKEECDGKEGYLYWSL